MPPEPKSSISSMTGLIKIPSLGVVVVHSSHLSANMDGVAISIGNNRIRIELYDRLTGAETEVAGAVHPTATLSRHAEFGLGIFVGADAYIGDDTIGKPGSYIEHDCRLERRTRLSMGDRQGGSHFDRRRRVLRSRHLDRSTHPGRCWVDMRSRFHPHWVRVGEGCTLGENPLHPVE